MPVCTVHIILNSEVINKASIKLIIDARRVKYIYILLYCSEAYTYIYSLFLFFYFGKTISIKERRGSLT